MSVSGRGTRLVGLGVGLLLLLFVYSPTSVQSNSLRVAAFNIRVFGVKKMNNPDVVNVLKEILPRYDIVFIQEIRDSTNRAIHKLVDVLNSLGEETWDVLLSKRLGRTSSKEQYAFLYKSDLVQVLDSFQWPDNGDYFEREPFIAHFAPTQSDYDIGSFAFMGVHVKPDAAPAEIDKLVDVYDGVSEMWGIEDMIIGGDFNADCSYVSNREWKNISLRHDPRFIWTIDDGIDTTMTDSNCAYDRLVLAGKGLLEDYVPGSATLYKFNEELDITQDLALAVSDHYPVELELA